MKLTTKVAAATIVAMISSSAVYAQNMQPVQNAQPLCGQNMEMPCANGGNMTNKRMMFQDGNRPMGGKHHKGQKGGKKGCDSGLGYLWNIEISDDQRHQIAISKSKMNTQMLEKLGSKNDRDLAKGFYSKDGFNEKEYVKMKSDRAKIKAEIKAKHIQNVYNILTPEQKAKFLENLK